MTDAAYPGFVKLRLRGPDGEIETPWAEALGDGLYRLDNLPWYAYGVSDDDVVEASPTEAVGVFDFVRVVRPSGNRLVRVVFEDDDEGRPTLEQLTRMGCHYEGANPSYVAVAIPPAVDLGAVAAFLTERGHRWEHANPTWEDLHPGT